MNCSVVQLPSRLDFEWGLVVLNGLHNRKIIVIIVFKLMHGIGCEVKSLWAAISNEQLAAVSVYRKRFAGNAPASRHKLMQLSLFLGNMSQIKLFSRGRTPVYVGAPR